VTARIRSGSCRTARPSTPTAALVLLHGLVQLYHGDRVVLSEEDVRTLCDRCLHHQSKGIAAEMRALLMVLVCAVASAVLFYFGTGLAPIGALTWLAPLPVLWLAPRLPWWGAAGLALVVWIAGATNMISYYARDLEVPVPLVAGLTLTGGLLLAGAVTAFRALLLAGQPLMAALAPPLIWVAGEFLVSVTQPHGAWWSLAYTQSSSRFMLQPLALTGVWGLSFLILFTPAVIAAAVLAERKIAIIAAAAVVLLAAASFSAVRLSATAKGGLIALSQRQDPVRLPSPLLRSYLDGIRELAERGASTIVAPEAVFHVDEPDLAHLTDALTALSREINATLVLGAVVGASNTALVAGPDGHLHRYAKRHLIPGLEDGLKPGSGTLVLDGGIGVLICKDLDFPDTVRDTRAAGARLLVAPAWDFDRDGWLHSRMALARSVQFRMPVLRSARTGRLTVTDAYGRVIAEAAYPGSLVADVTVAA
jgi:apolipoprotein N-acyltransferase